MKPEITFEMLTTDQLKGLLDVREGKNLPYALWRELHILGLVKVNMSADDESPLMDVLTDRGLELIGVLTHG